MLITGSTGSFGKALVTYLLRIHRPSRVVVYSRDELKQSDMRRALHNDARVRWFIGDVRDRARLVSAMRGIDYVVHAAALKQVDTAEYNPYEVVQTNVHGSQNVIEAALETAVKRVVALSTDKACRPVNLYGASKLVADKLFVAANHAAADAVTRFAIVRYGNVIGSRGSVVPIFRQLAREGKSLPITDKRMTRFWIALEQAVRFVVDSLEMMQGGELYVPRIPSMRIVDLAEAVAPGAVMHEIGIRPGEKLHEEMIGPDDSPHVVRIGDRYVVQPAIKTWQYEPPETAEPVPEGFTYRSNTNDQWLNVEGLRAVLRAGSGEA